MILVVIIAALPLLALADDPLDDPTVTQMGNDLFNGIDLDKDGKIVPAEAEKFFLAFDNNQDGVVSYDEFKKSLYSVDPAFVGHELALFNLFDMAQDQEVDKADIDIVFKAADLNGDGEVSKDEFSKIFAEVITHLG